MGQPRHNLTEERITGMTLNQYIEQYNALQFEFAPWSYLLSAVGVAIGIAIWEGIKSLWRRR